LVRVEIDEEFSVEGFEAAAANEPATRREAAIGRNFILDIKVLNSRWGN